MPEWKEEVRKRLSRLNLEPAHEAEVVEELAQHVDDVYQRALAFELRDRGLPVVQEAAINVWYRGTRVGYFRADLLVEDQVIVELKTASGFTAVDRDRLPADLRTALTANSAALAAWKDITPLARNEFICWVEDAKQQATRERRIRRTREELEDGMRRPCCWPGCKHRERTGR